MSEEREQQPELGGAEALLRLGHKNKAEIASENEQLSNEAVEAAVMRYVGGIDQGKKRFADDLSNISEFQTWTGFLEEDLNDEENFFHNATPLSPQKRRKTNKKRLHGQPHNVDPELAQLDTATSEHEQLVQAAIMDARALASQLGPLDQDYLRQHDEKVGLNSNTNSENNTAHQADHHIDGLNNKITPADISANAALVAEAAAKASSWVSQPSSGKMFSNEEIQAIDSFVSDYCSIHNMSRTDICHRIWSNERKKDDFWETLTKVLPHRSRASVYKHVRRTYHIFNVRGKWTPQEDEELSKLVNEKEGQWKNIGQIMGRMPEDCRDRWRNYVKCGNQRASNKWSAEEEEKLKQVIHSILSEHDPVINWTVVSEKMGGQRSRIQCRYKWNKLLKREAVARAKSMDTQDRIWLLTRLKDLGFENSEIVDWNVLASLHPKNLWSGPDLKMCFEKMRSSIREFRLKSLNEILDLLLQDIARDVPYDRDQSKIEAVAAAAVGNDDYMWR